MVPSRLLTLMNFTKSYIAGILKKDLSGEIEADNELSDHELASYFPLESRDKKWYCFFYIHRGKNVDTSIGFDFVYVPKVFNVYMIIVYCRTTD